MIKRHHILLLIPIVVLPVWLVLRLDTSTKTNRLPSTPSVPTAVHNPVAPEIAGEVDFAEHVEKLRKKLPSTDFSIVIQRPFVVIGDEPVTAVKEHSEGTVKWAVEKLKQDYFAKDPKEILDIWLFKDSASYERNTLALFGERPTTPYGYYSSAHKALIMNISTGGGTLVHEIVHPFMEANFPACPPWLNEGLGSLYEQCGEEEGHIHGYTNWRLPGLQKAIRAGEVPSFKSLTSLDASAFYNDDRGTNYAESRYLCFYLQQRGLLREFYREFHAHQQSDLTGYATLKRILQVRDMNSFQKKWESYVLSLTQDVVLTPVPPDSKH